MIPVIPWYVTLSVFLATATASVGTWLLVSSAASRSMLPGDAQRRVRFGTGLYLVLWLLAVLALAPKPESVAGREAFYITPLIPLFAIASITVAIVALWRSAALRQALDAISVPGTIAVQAYRAIGFVFLILLAQGQLPAHFADPAGWGDILIGITAPLVAVALASGARAGRALAYIWNVVGLLDLVTAIGMGTGVLMALLAGSRAPAATAMGIFPMILVPAYVVPLSVLLHVVAIRGLRRQHPRVSGAVGRETVTVPR